MGSPAVSQRNDRAPTWALLPASSPAWTAFYSVVSKSTAFTQWWILPSLNAPSLERGVFPEPAGMNRHLFLHFSLAPFAYSWLHALHGNVHPHAHISRVPWGWCLSCPPHLCSHGLGLCFGCVRSVGMRMDCTSEFREQMTGIGEDVLRPERNENPKLYDLVIQESSIKQSFIEHYLKRKVHTALWLLGNPVQSGKDILWALLPGAVVLKVWSGNPCGSLTQSEGLWNQNYLKSNPKI